jgi:hypothetical protein
MKTQLAAPPINSTFFKDILYLLVASVVGVCVGLFCYTEVVEFFQQVELPNPHYNEVMTTLRQIN